MTECDRNNAVYTKIQATIQHRTDKQRKTKSHPIQTVIICGKQILTDLIFRIYQRNDNNLI